MSECARYIYGLVAFSYAFGQINLDGRYRSSQKWHPPNEDGYTSGWGDGLKKAEIAVSKPEKCPHEYLILRKDAFTHFLHWATFYDLLSAAAVGE